MPTKFRYYAVIYIAIFVALSALFRRSLHIEAIAVYAITAAVISGIVMLTPAPKQMSAPQLILFMLLSPLAALRSFCDWVYLKVSKRR
jgi:hypothetical protein